MRMIRIIFQGDFWPGLFTLAASLLSWVIALVTGSIALWGENHLECTLRAQTGSQMDLDFTLNLHFLGIWPLSVSHI